LTESLEGFRRSARALADLDLEARRIAFQRLLAEVLPWIEDHARTTGDVLFLVTTMSEVWQIGYDLGVVMLPPPSAADGPGNQGEKDS
jgi:hypothetical protein